jgi:hypothetical protein
MNTVGRVGTVRFKVLDHPDARSLWHKIEADFPVEMDWIAQDVGPEAFHWLEAASDMAREDKSPLPPGEGQGEGGGAREPSVATQQAPHPLPLSQRERGVRAAIERRMIARVLDELGAAGERIQKEQERLVKAAAPSGDPRWLDLYARACRLRRQVRLQPMLAKWRQIVFARHHVMGGSFFAYTEAQSDAQGERYFGPGAALCMAELTAEPTWEVRTLIDDPTGVIRDADVSYDGRRILFAWKKSAAQDDLHLYETDAASGETRQLTFGLGFADYEPAYLPNGHIVFSSTRCVQSVDCAGFFTAPARTPLYFQALDADGYMVQSMRSWATLQPGENASCVGCHESKNSAPLTGKNSYALRRGPETLTPFYGPPRGFSFPREIQPILDRHCTSCHNDRMHTLPAGALRYDLCGVLSPIGAEWRYATQDPGKGWEQPDFDASAWKTGPAPLGPNGATRLGFVAKLWIRRTFEVPADRVASQPLVSMRNIGLAEVYLNGRLVAKPGEFSYQFRTIAVRPEAGALRPGKNLLAVHCAHDRGEAHLDVTPLDGGSGARPGSGPGQTAADGKSPAFSLLADEAVDRVALRRWSDAYLALTQAQVSRDASAPALGKSNDLVNWISPQSAPPVQPPYLTGAAKSRLMVLLRQGHYQVKLSQEELDKIACWIDLAVPYCGDYAEAGAWDDAARARHERYVNKRRSMEEIERNNIRAFVEDGQGSARRSADRR